jgi:hypothetical protein
MVKILVLIFQRSLFLRMTTLLAQTKSTLLLKNKCNHTAIYMKTQCLQTNETQNYLGKENALGAGGEVGRVALIKSLIKQDRENVLRAQG